MLHDGSSLRASALRVAALTRHNLLLRRRDPSNLLTYAHTEQGSGQVVPAYLAARARSAAMFTQRGVRVRWR